MKKYICTLFCLILSVVSAFADSVKTINTVKDFDEVILPVDSAALNIAIEKISVNDDKNMLMAYILTGKRATAGSMITLCNGIGISLAECGAFVNEYVDILTSRTSCLTANNFTKAEWYGSEYSLQNCYKHIDGVWRRDSDDSFYEGDIYEGNSLVGQCKRIVKAAEKCQIYLYYHYKDKLLDPDITKKQKKEYNCILEKLETGEMEIPTTKMIKDCK